MQYLHRVPKPQMTPAQRKWIDEASYEELLQRWLFRSAEDPLFEGNTKNYFVHEMMEKGSKLQSSERNRIIKSFMT